LIVWKIHQYPISEWCNSQKQSSSNFRQLLHEHMEKANPRRELTVEEATRLAKLECIDSEVNRGENVQNHQLQTWLREEKYEQFDYKRQEQMPPHEELRGKPIEQCH
jgi:hypothetical protein